MGKAIKLKEQRKIERIAREQRKENRRKILLRAIVGISILIIIFGGSYLGGIYAKNNWFESKNTASKNASKTSTSSSSITRVFSKPPAMTININKQYTADFTTSEGNFEVSLDAKDTPVTVNNFVFLANQKFYDGLTFHRIIKDFMIQGGDPKGNGSGGPGYKFNDEKIVGDYTPGTVAMANSGANTNGSQFFIMAGDYSNGKLPKNYVIFGKVVSGMDTVKKIADVKVTDNGQGEKSKPVVPVFIKNVTIEEK